MVLINKINWTATLVPQDQSKIIADMWQTILNGRGYRSKMGCRALTMKVDARKIRGRLQNAVLPQLVR